MIVLDAKRDREFLEQQRIDPVMKTLLEPGDRVVVCAHCRLVFREYTWAEIRGKFGHGTETLPYLPVDSVHFGRSTPDPAPSYAPPAPAPEPDHVRPVDHAPQGPSPAQQAWSAVLNLTRRFSNRVRERSNRTDSSGAEVLELREIPFELEEIPFKLREVSPY